GRPGTLLRPRGPAAAFAPDRLARPVSFPVGPPQTRVDPRRHRCRRSARVPGRLVPRAARAIARRAPRGPPDGRLGRGRVRLRALRLRPAQGSRWHARRSARRRRLRADGAGRDLDGRLAAGILTLIDRCSRASLPGGAAIEYAFEQLAFSLPGATCRVPFT